MKRWQCIVNTQGHKANPLIALKRTKQCCTICLAAGVGVQTIGEHWNWRKHQTLRLGEKNQSIGEKKLNLWCWAACFTPQRQAMSRQIFHFPQSDIIKTLIRLHLLQVRRSIIRTMVPPSSCVFPHLGTQNHWWIHQRSKVCQQCSNQETATILDKNCRFTIDYIWLFEHETLFVSKNLLLAYRSSKCDSKSASTLDWIHVQPDSPGIYFYLTSTKLSQ